MSEGAPPQPPSAGQQKPVRDHAITLLIGLVVGYFTSFLLPSLREKDLVLAYTMQGPRLLVSSDVMGSTTIKGQNASELYAYEIRLWNDGELEPDAFDVTIQFEGEDEFPDDFAVIHKSVRGNRDFLNKLLNPAQSSERWMNHEWTDVDWKPDRNLRLVFDGLKRDWSYDVLLVTNYGPALSEVASKKVTLSHRPLIDGGSRLRSGNLWIGVAAGIVATALAYLALRRIKTRRS